MVDLGILGDIIGNELSSPNGREHVMKFLTSPEGVALLEEFFERPEARPLGLIVATAGLEEVHVTKLVRSCVLPSE